jgi:CRP/FNR family transcriptional regulator, nitrogen fixation regulation protein
MSSQISVKNAATGAMGNSSFSLAASVPGNDDVFGMIGAVVPFARNSEIFGQEEPADYIYKVTSGAVRTSRILADGRRQIGDFYLAGDILGIEVSDLHTFSAEAISDCKILVVKRSALMAAAARDASIARTLWDAMGRELKRVQQHSLALVKTAQERVAGFLIEMLERTSKGNLLELPMSRQDIADYLGLTIETVSRIVGQLERSAIIDLRASRQIIIQNKTALQSLNS